jgi:predicted aspartyl protease
MGRYVLLLWLCASLMPLTAAGQSTPDEYTVPVKLYSGHVIVVQGSIGSLSKRNLVIDTGAYPSVIDHSLVKKLGLPTQAGEMRVVAYTLKTESVVLPEVRIGPLAAHNIQVVAQDLGTLSEQLGVRVDALIGLDVLAIANFRVDYTTRMLVFGPPVRLTSAAPIRKAAGMACLDVRMNGRPQLLLLDTGAADLVLFADRAPWLPRLIAGGELESTNLGGSIPMRAMMMNEFDVGGQKLGSQEVYVSAPKNMGLYPFDGMFSPTALRLRQIAFDFDHQVFSWEMEAPGKKSGTGDAGRPQRMDGVIVEMRGAPPQMSLGFSQHAVVPSIK